MWANQRRGFKTSRRLSGSILTILIGLIFIASIGMCHLVLGHVDEAIDLLRKARAENPRFWFIHFWLAGGLGLKGDLDEARTALADSLRLKPEMNSLARRRADVPWVANPSYWDLQEKSLNVGLRRAGFSEE